MATFTDSENKVWEVRLSVSGAKRIRSMLGLDLLGEDMHKIFADPINMIDTVYVLCKDEADRESIDDYQFGLRIHGQVIEDARNALVEATADFFPNPQQREQFRKMIERIDMLQSHMLGVAKEMLGDENFENSLRQATENLLETLGSVSTSAPESSDSTPDLLPSGS